MQTLPSYIRRQVCSTAAQQCDNVDSVETSAQQQNLVSSVGLATQPHLDSNGIPTQHRHLNPAKTPTQQHLDPGDVTMQDHLDSEIASRASEVQLRANRAIVAAITLASQLGANDLPWKKNISVELIASAEGWQASTARCITPTSHK
jgi:hypothetical protein